MQDFINFGKEIAPYAIGLAVIIMIVQNMGILLMLVAGGALYFGCFLVPVLITSWLNKRAYAKKNPH